jgi:eukaryotic-like serine/threonine-protein kinase
METLTPSVGPLSRNEPIPGYVLKARLGSGGYGEVWEAEAPGGLRKALKFVYGRLDESRAQSELKSLNRIKEIGHPFLLSIERIEVVDGRLVIVTELAQGCLKARFDACRQAGMQGIPRDELLGYIRDTADALDFIHDRHGLQHLDVKPENLLMVGNHVKVADFGLLKDLKESLSSVGGLTAIYCPPEALNGRPSGHSDQYSLAIVYQEMLTGQLPFGGRTAAQLAAQHLHSPPMLAVLPPADQPVMARALSKNPDQRFPNCRSFADTLIELGDSRSRSARRAPPSGRRSTPRGRPTKTEPLDAQVASAASGKAPGAASAASARRSSEIRNLPRIDLATADQRRRPAIFVGVGGTGGRILSQLQHRLHEAYGSGENVPAVQMLLLDTDSKDLSSLIFKRGSGSIPARSTLAIPLRAPKDYRSDSHKILEWLSRRWLYNIPRSLQTEGLRPLGRLAFVDHSARIFDRLHEAVELATSADSIEQTRQATGLDFIADAPNVFVVGSLSGGTGSGIAIDLGYAVRKILGELQLPDQRVFGFLTHSTSRKAASRDLAVVNTLTALQELRHFGGRNGFFAGDSSCDLPEFCEQPAAFHETYLVQLGNDLGEREFEAAADRLAEYLFQNTLAAGAPFFELSRLLAGNGANENSLAADRLRTVGMAILEPPGPEPAEPEAPETPTDEAGLETHNGADDTQHLTAQPSSLADKCKAAAPELIGCGGARQTLVLAPADVDRERLVQANPGIPQESLTFVEHARQEVVICQEIAEVPIARVIKQLAGTRRDYGELADRLHTRIDVDWPPLCLAGLD